MGFKPEQERAYDRAAALCARSETCAADLLKKLKAWKLADGEAAAVINRLQSDGFLNDERFASAYVRDKFRFNGWGKRKILLMLRTKHIAPDILETVFEQIEDGAFAEKLRKLMVKKAKQFKGQDPYQKRVRLMRFALSRGFDLDEVNAMLAELGL